MAIQTIRFILGELRWWCVWGSGPFCLGWQMGAHTAGCGHSLSSIEACGVCSGFSPQSSLCPGPNHSTLYCRHCLHPLYNVRLVSFHTFYSLAETSHFFGGTLCWSVGLLVCLFIFFESFYFVICLKSVHNFSCSIFIMSASKSLSSNFHTLTLRVLVFTDCNFSISSRCSWFSMGVLFF